MGGETRSDALQAFDLEMLARKARWPETPGFLGEALTAWWAVVRIGRNSLPAWEILRKLRVDAHRERTAQ